MFLSTQLGNMNPDLVLFPAIPVACAFRPLFVLYPVQGVFSPPSLPGKLLYPLLKQPIQDSPALSPFP